MIIIGCDEVGYGCLAGPLVVCGVAAPEGWNLEGLNDSKKLSDKQRHEMLLKLMKLPETDKIIWHIAVRSNTEIDFAGVVVALKSAYVEVFHALYELKSSIIVDGNLKFDKLGVDAYNIQSIVKADTKIPTVMAASIIAKTFRDDRMKTLHFKYPHYNWIKNVGYGTPDHLQAINQYGPCELHRYSYAPMKNMRNDDSRRTSESQSSSSQNIVADATSENSARFKRDC
jgi:ribonuclease HII